MLKNLVFIFAAMQVIELEAVYGDQKKKLSIFLPSHGGSFQILIDNYMQGTITPSSQGWIVHLNPQSQLTADDLLILYDLIQGHNEGAE